MIPVRGNWLMLNFKVEGSNCPYRNRVHRDRPVKTGKERGSLNAIVQEQLFEID